MGPPKRSITLKAKK